MFLLALAVVVGCGILGASKFAIRQQPIEADPALEHKILAEFANDPVVLGQLHTLAWHPDVIAKTRLTVPVAIPSRTSQTWGKLVEFKWHRDHRWNAGKMKAEGEVGRWSYSYKPLVALFFAGVYAAAFYNSAVVLGVGIGITILNACLHSEVDRVTGYVSERSWVTLNALATLAVLASGVPTWAKVAAVAGAALLPFVPTGPLPKGDVYLGWAGGVLPGVVLQSFGYVVAVFTLASVLVVLTWLAVRVATRRPVLAIPFGVGWPLAILVCMWLRVAAQ